MTSRERELAAIRHEVPDRVPLDVICIEIQEEIADHLSIEAGEVYDALGIDGRIVAAGYTGPECRGPQGQPLDPWGGEPLLDYGRAHWYPLSGATTVAEVERHAWPDPENFDYAGAAAVAAALGDRYAVRGPYWLPLFCRVCGLMGMEEAMAAMVTRPAVFEAVLEGVFSVTREYCRRLLNACGDAMPILCLGDDFATQRGMMISPESWRRFLKPCFAQLFALGKSRGKFVWFHSCGDITPILPDLIEIGMDVWETVQLHALPMAAEELKREFGRDLTFFGGINTQHLPHSSPAEVAAEVRRRIEQLGAGGGYICGPDHHLKPDVAAPVAVTLFATARDFRAPGYTAPL